MCRWILFKHHTKDIEKEFTPGVHLDTFKTEDEMIEKISFYLDDDNLRTKIAQSGKELVQSKHQFIHRLEIILKDAGI